METVSKSPMTLQVGIQQKASPPPPHPFKNVYEGYYNILVCVTFSYCLIFIYLFIYLFIYRNKVSLYYLQAYSII